MTRLGVLILVLMLTSMALVGGAMLYGQAYGEPNRLRTLGFDLCQGKPCFKGILPGGTLFSEAVSNLWTPANGGAVTYHSGELFVGDDVIIQGFNEVSKPVRYVFFQRHATGADLGLTMGQLIDVYGSPCFINVAVPGESKFTDVYLVYPSIEANVNLHNGNMTPEVLLQALEISDQSNFCQKPTGKPWKGFVSPYHLLNTR